MKPFALLIAAACCCFTAAADKLDEVEALINTIERGYWSTIRLGGDTRRGMDSRLSAALNLARDIQQKSRASGNSDLTRPLLALQRIFSDMRPADLQKFNLKFRTTAMRDYRPEFRRWLREQQEKEPPQTGEGAAANRRRPEIEPTLATVDLDAYSAWVTEVTDKNIEKIRTGSREPSSRERSVRDQIAEYHGAILSLRVGMVGLRRAFGTDKFK